MYADVNGVRLAYVDRGQHHDATLLLIHGFPLDHHLWAGQLAGLSPLVRVVAPDLRGHGKSEVPPGPYSMEGHADDMASLMDYLGIRRAVVAGLSMGGYIAFAFWRRHPKRVQALILADTRAEPDSPQAKANRDVAIATVQRDGAAAYAREFLPKVLGPTSQADGRIADRTFAMMAAQPVQGTIEALKALRDRPDSRPDLPAINVPVLVLVGAEDALTPPADAEAMARAIPGAQMTVAPGAGHLCPLENARFVNSTLRRFLRELGSAAAGPVRSG